MISLGPVLNYPSFCSADKTVILFLSDSLSIDVVGKGKARELELKSFQILLANIRKVSADADPGTGCPPSRLYS